MDILNGKKVIVSNYITKEVQCRKHKKKRINKKWLKKYGYKRIPDNNTMYMVNDTIMMTQKCLDKLGNLIEHYDEVRI